jgi:predicted NBD/HSP70 family sugar kinase
VLAARLADHGRLTAEDVGLAARAGDPLAASEVDRGSRLIGATAANLVNFVNPGTVVLGGGALRVGERVFRIFEETLLRRTSKLAAQRLTVRPASLYFREGVTGAAILAIEQLFGPGAVGLWIEDGSPVGHAVPLHRTAVV